MTLNYTIRVYELLPDGSLQALSLGPSSLFQGAFPNVGDTIARFDLSTQAFRYYGVQRRIFVNSLDGEDGCAILVRETPASAILEQVTAEWVDETEFWRDVVQEERHKETMAAIAQLLPKPKAKLKTTPKKKPRKRKLVPPGER